MIPANKAKVAGSLTPVGIEETPAFTLALS